LGKLDYLVVLIVSRYLNCYIYITGKSNISQVINSTYYFGLKIILLYHKTAGLWRFWDVILGFLFWNKGRGGWITPTQTSFGL